ncbi:MAG: hypothetical protein LBP80_11075 [Treponema sp.]|jgi:ESS family glutamate:Na+ symporter|nr:hypothetical protein [Treponema sp.]
MPVKDSIDRLSIQAALVPAVYLLTYGLILGLTRLLRQYAPAAGETFSALLWGFNFMAGIGAAQLISFILKKLRQRRILKRQYQNNFLLSRISGLTFDIMITAAIASIDISELRGLLLPFILMSLLGAFSTLWYLQWLCPKIYPGYKYEGILSMYGMLTGTISSGVLLLREMDPQLKSPALYNLVSGSGIAILFGAPVLAFVGLAPQSIPLALLTLGLMCLYFLVLAVFMVKPGRAKTEGQNRRQIQNLSERSA